MKTAEDIAKEMARRPLKNWSDTDKVESGRILFDKLSGLSSNARLRIAEVLDGGKKFLPRATELISLVKAARILGVSQRTISRMVKAGRLKAVTTQTKHKISGKALNDFLNQEQSQQQ